MSFRFRKSIKLAPGIRLNLTTRGVSATIGPRGASLNVGRRGTYANVGIPGTGLSSRTRLDVPGAPRHAYTQRVDSVEAPYEPPAYQPAPQRARLGWVVILLAGIAIGLMIASLR